MADQLDGVQAVVDAAASGRAYRFKWFVRGVKVLFVALAAAVAGVAQFIAWNAPVGPSSAQITGICATAVAFFGALINLLLEEDAGEQLAAARTGIAAAREAEAAAKLSRQQYLSYNSVVDRIIELHRATEVMRAALEQSTVAIVGTEGQLAANILRLAGRSLSIAAAFEQSDQWTICIYQAVPVSGSDRFELRCTAHHRAIECDIRSARTWPEGVGIAGLSFSNAREVIVDDLADDSLRSVFQPAGLRRDYDDDRYRSMAAIPIKVEGMARPWGIVTATSARSAHFNHNSEPGLKNEESIRSLAGFIALAVALHRSKARTASFSPQVRP